MDITTIDVNGDFVEDIILSGNIYETEVETPRLDAISGLVLISDGQSSYKPLPYWEAGLYLSGNVKSVDIFDMDNDRILVSSVNNGPIKVYKILSQ